MDGAIREKNSNITTSILWGIIITCCIVWAYITTRYLMLVALVISCAYIIGIDDDEQSTVMLVFIFFFSTIFKFQTGQTSLFFVCKLAYIFRMLCRGYIKRVKYPFIWELFFGAYCVLSMVFGGTGAVIRIINLLLWMCIAYIMLAENVVNKIELFKTEIIAFFLSCIVSIIGENIPSFAAEISNELANYDPVYGSDIVRYTGIFGDPNMTSVYIILTMFSCLYLYKNWRLPSIVFLGAEVALTGIGISTGSKSCFLLMIIFWAAFLFMRTDRKIVKGFVFCIAVVVTLTFSTTSLYSFYEYRFFGSPSGITSNRTDIWVTYVEQLNEDGLLNWILGYGINTSNLPNGRAAHNVFLQVIYNCGIVGLISYLLYWISLFRVYIQKNSYKNSNKKLDFMGLMPIICMVATTFFLDSFFLEGFYFAIPIAILMYGNETELNEVNHE